MRTRIKVAEKQKGARVFARASGDRVETPKKVKEKMKEGMEGLDKKRDKFQEYINLTRIGCY